MMRFATTLFAFTNLLVGLLTAQADATDTIQGRVVDLRGEPVPAAEVQVVTSRDPATFLARGVSDGDG